MAYLAGPATSLPTGAPSAAAAAGAAAAALLQRQLLGSSGGEVGWSEHQTGDGRKFYHNEETQVSQWEKPEALMSAEERTHNTLWQQYRIWDGRVFYHNKETKVSCWSMPPELRKLRGESTGLDERPLPETTAEKRKAFLDLLKEKGLDASWDFNRVLQATAGTPEAEALSDSARKQCFAEQISLLLKQGEIQARSKERNAAVALERLIEEHFSQPEDLATTYEEAAQALGREEPWQLVKSDVRRDEVFQTVMERLEEKHQKARAEKRTERVVRLQRLIATDPELRRSRLRWKDATAVLARRDELQEEEPPVEALRVWCSLRDMRKSSENDFKADREPTAFREERKRRDAFCQALKELAAAGVVTADISWAEVEAILESDQRCTAIREGQGATAMELFDEFIEDLSRRGADAYAGVLPAVVAGDQSVYAPPVDTADEPLAKKPRLDGHTLQQTKEEYIAAEEDDQNALDMLIAAAQGLEENQEDEEDDPLMGAALKAAARRHSSSG